MAFFIRQAVIGSIRTKLVIAFVIVAVGSVGIVSFISSRSYRQSLSEDISNNLVELATARSTEIGLTLGRELQLIKALAINRT
ncbi:MAG TPA: hypothetical protein DCE18_19255, partial [Syntrophobacteraceae bacterium]|nr:hypothetical protein [Syntrophobacteraceae bacterium]